MSSKHKVVLLGSRSQSHPMFTWCRGKQCVAMGASFLMYCTTKEVAIFNRYDVNSILDTGNLIYQQVFDHVQHELLSVDELPGFISKGDVRYKFELGLLRYGDITTARSLTYQLANVFANYTNAFFVCNGMCITLKFLSGKYYLYDSHNRNRHGLQASEGVACVITFSMFHLLCTHLQKLLGHATIPQFEIWPCSLQREIKSNNVGDEVFCDMAVPIFHVQSKIVPVFPSNKKTETSKQSSNVQVDSSCKVPCNKKLPGKKSNENVPRSTERDLLNQSKLKTPKPTSKSKGTSKSTLIKCFKCDKEHCKHGTDKVPVQPRTLRPRKCKVEGSYNIEKVFGKQETLSEEKEHVKPRPTGKRKTAKTKKPTAKSMSNEMESDSEPDIFQEIAKKNKKRKLSHIELSDSNMDKVNLVKSTFGTAETAVFSKNGELLTVDGETVSQSTCTSKKNVSQKTETRPSKIHIRKTKNNWHIFQSKKEKVFGDFNIKEKRKLHKILQECDKLQCSSAIITINGNAWETSYETFSSSINDNVQSELHKVQEECETLQTENCNLENVQSHLKDNVHVNIPGIEDVDMTDENVREEVLGHVLLAERDSSSDENMNCDIETENNYTSLHPKTQKKKPLWKWAKKRGHVKVNKDKKKIESLKRQERRQRQRDKLVNLNNQIENKSTDIESLKDSNIEQDIYNCTNSEKLETVQSTIDIVHSDTEKSPIYNVTNSPESIPSEGTDDIQMTDNETIPQVYSDIDDNDCLSEVDIHEPDDLVDSFESNNDIDESYVMSKTFITNSQYTYISSIKVTLLNKGIDNVCRTCTKMCFPEQGRVLTEKSKQKFSHFIPENVLDINWFVCQSCINYFNRQKLPPICTKNNIKWPEVPADLQISPDEERLLALRIPFMQIQILPSGFQKQLKGNVINVPTDVTSTVDILPRYVNENGVVTVRLKRKMEYKSVYRKCNIRPAKVLKALEWLLSNSLYYVQSNITVNRDWLQETVAFLEREEVLNANDKTNNDTDNDIDMLNSNVPNIDINITNDSVEQINSETEQGNANDKNGNNKNEQEKDKENDNFSEIDVADHHVQFNSLIEREEDPLYCDIAPAEGRKPIHMFYDKLGEEMCFPTMYAGKTISELFPEDLATLKRVRWQLTSADRRAAGNAEFIFLHYKKYQMTYVHDKVDFSIRCLKNVQQYTVHDVLDDLHCRNIARLDDGYYYFQKLRNSPQYLHERKRELLATVRQFGIPTFFISLSCADTHWVVLLQSIGKVIDKKSYSSEEIKAMSFIDKTRLINADPVSTARYFDRRFHYFLKEILYKSPYPIGKVTNHFYRIEFQHRGSPHVHMLVYCEDCPRYNKTGNNEQLVKYADTYISCSTTVPEHMQPYLMLQKHKHSRTCRKSGKSICRFGFPLPPFNKTVILKRNPNATLEQRQKYKEIQTYLDSDLVTEQTTLQNVLDHFQMTYSEYISIVRSTLTNDKLFLQRKPSEGRVNMYMKNLLHVWEANMDCQMCLNAHTVIEYIVNYINKENRGLSLNLDKVAKECESKHCSTRETIKKLGHVFVNTTEVSVQECIYVLLGLPLTFFSVDVIHVPTFEQEKRTKVVKNKRLLENEPLDSIDIYTEEKFQKYQSRPLFFEKWCLADYITQVVIFKRTPASFQKEPLGYFISKSGVQSFNSNTHKFRIGKQRVLSYITPTLQKERENYYRIQLLLFHPWRVEITSTIAQRSFESYYLNLSLDERESILRNIEKYNTEKIADIEALYKQLSRDNHHLVVATETDHRNADDIEEGTNCLTDGSFFQPTENVDDIASDNPMSEHNISTDHISSIVNKLWPTETLFANVLKLNQGQRDIYDYVLKHVIRNDEPLRLFITGGAGTGKTLLLHSLYQSLSRHFNLQPDLNADLNSVLCLASTGKAAYLIKGNTIHSGLNIKTRKRNRHATRLGPDELNTLRCKLQYLQCVLIDEISLVGSKLFRQVDLRLQHVFGNYEPFGGRHVICFGDLYQLPPVRDTWIFESSHRGLEVFTDNVWTEHFTMYELTETMRQQDGQIFAEILNRMRIGAVTDNDIRILKTREVPQEQSMEMVNVMHIYSTNDGVKYFNGLCFQGCQNDKFTITSVDKTLEKLTEAQITEAEGYLITTTDTGSLVRDLELAIGLLYELSYNINIPDGLVNGAYGYLRHVQFSDSNDKPIAIWLEFEETCIGSCQRMTYRRYRTPEIDKSWTPIFSRTADFQITEMNLSVQRTQFPVKQSTGKTIHKSQGSTVPKVVVDLTGWTFRNGCYVACSRVRELEDLFLVKFHRNQIVTDPKVD